MRRMHPHPGEKVVTRADSSTVRHPTRRRLLLAPAQLDSLLVNNSSSHADAFMFLPDKLFNTMRKRIVAYALKNQLPTIAATREWTDDGCLMSYGIDVPD